MSERSGKNAGDDDSEELLAIGILRGPHGVKGEIRLQSLSGENTHIKKLKILNLAFGETKKSLKVEYFREDATGLRVKFVGIDSPEAVAPYKSWELLVSRAEACPLGKNEWYIKDLIGCALLYEGKTVAEIVSVHESGASELLEALSLDGSRHFVPFLEKFIGDVDISRREIELKLLWILE